MAGVQAAGHEKLTRPFRGRFEKGGCLHFEEALLVQEDAGSSAHFVPNAEVASHLWTAKVQVPVLQSQFFVYLGSNLGIVDREWQHFRVIKQFQRRNSDLDLTGGNLRIVGPGR